MNFDGPGVRLVEIIFPPPFNPVVPGGSHSCAIELASYGAMQPSCPTRDPQASVVNYTVVKRSCFLL